jgi:outer membrane immunogenic protein
VTSQYPANSGFALVGATYTIGSALSTDWLMTVRGRVGFAQSNWLLYATGGLAVTRMTVANSFSDNFVLGASESSSESKVKTGFAVGAGGEVALTSNWSVKIEYLYLDFGRVSTQGLVTNPTAGTVGYANTLGVSSDLTAHMGRVGFNFKF